MLKLIPEQALQSHIAALGKTGSGKTSTVKLIIEHAVREENARVCILDPLKSDHWGLTMDADGKRSGLPFHILGGPYGQVPLHAAAGASIGQIVASGALRHSIIDMADFDVGDHQRFFIAFAQSLFRNMKGVVYLVVEEAHIFAPKEKAGFGDESKSTHWMTKLATGARSKGIRLVVATQRTQSLHNAVLGSCDTVLAHRLVLPADQKPVADWLKGNCGDATMKEVVGSLSSLTKGEAWVCTVEPQAVKRVQFPRITTYDNTATPTNDTPKDVRPKAVNTDALRSIIGDAVKEADANDPKKLKARIAELEKAARNSTTPKPSGVDPKAVDRAVSQAVAARDKHWQGELRKFEQRDRDFTGRLSKIATLAHLNGQAAAPEIVKPVDVVTRIQPNSTPITQRPNARTSAPAIVGELTITNTQQRILDALAYWESMGVNEPTGAQLGAVALMDTTGGHFSNVVGPLSTAGLVERSNGVTTLTDAGRAIANAPEIPPTLDEHHKSVRQRVQKVKAAGGKTLDILNAVIARGGDAITQEEIGHECSMDHTGGHFSNMIGPLSTLGLIERKKGVVTPTKLLFPEGMA